MSDQAPAKVQISKPQRRVALAVMAGALVAGLAGAWQVPGRTAEVAPNSTWASSKHRVDCDRGRDVILEHARLRVRSLGITTERTFQLDPVLPWAPEYVAADASASNLCRLAS